MLPLITALLLLNPDPTVITPERAQQYFKDYHIFCAPDTICHGLKAPVPVSGPLSSPVRTRGRTFSFQEGPTTPQIEVYAGPLWPPRAPGRFVLTTPKKP
jgi:hypothetical protein